VTLSARYAYRNERFDAYGLNAAGMPVPLRDRDNILSVGVSLPLFTRSRNVGNIEAAGARAAAARLRREHLERTIPLEVEAAWRRQEAARRALDLLNSGVVRQSEKNLEIVREAHSLGHLRMLDVLNEQRRVVETELAYVDAAAELARAAAELEHTVGGGLQ
jgi:cobalt-zinc-cadmium efflux system outer membrane protein